MRPYSSVPTMWKPAGRWCSPFWMPGPTNRRRAFPTIRPAAMARPPRLRCWRKMATLGDRSSPERITESTLMAKPPKTSQIPEIPKISLVLADVDGTLVTEDKVLTKRAQAAVQRLYDVGIRFAITSGRPPMGMAMLFDDLKLATPIAGFNGGLFVKRDLSIIEQKTLPADVAAKAIDLIREHGLDAWVYRGNDWLITRSDAPHVAREVWTVKFEPKVVADFRGKLGDVAKIVGISDDRDKVQRCEADAQTAFGQRATASRSQPYYLDVTHKDANKGAVRSEEH